ncbi:MAG: Fe-S cluster assembly protein SufD [Kiloniellaceae bacterium]
MPRSPSRPPDISSPTGPSFVEQFGACKAELPGMGLSWVRDLREAGIERFAAHGLPSPRLEAWKYTSLRPLAKLDFVPAPSGSASIDKLPTLLPGGEGGHRLVFVNGAFRADLSRLGDLPEGAEIGGLAAALERGPDGIAAHLGRIGDGAEQPMLALNTAMMRDGLALRLKRGVRVAMPIEVVFLGAAGPAPMAYHPRNLIVLEPGSRAFVIEHHSGLGEGAYFANGGTEILIGDGAALNHYKLQAEAPDAFHLSTVHVRLGRGAYYDAFTLSTGARLSRNESHVRLDGPGANCRLNGAYLMRGQQHCDNTTVIEHLKERTSCREVFKGVIDDKARAVFRGRIVVHPHAQKSDGHQLSKALLLSSMAEVDTKPELEIYADDVKCSHGATVGDLDHDALFYLRSRGIPEAAARNILIEAFLAETIDEIAAGGLCPALMSSVGHWLADA